MNPGGDAYDQLSSLGATGRQNIIDFINRGDSGYVGFCAGGYIASHDYLWESMYEGPGYYNFAVDPPLSVFPHTVEGSLTDINDDQFADQSGEGVDYRLVNVSNGQKMLYYGGSSFGWNGSPAYHDAADPEHDSKVDVLLYFTDFFGFKTFNLPAVWRYGNLLLTSVHPEADNCTTYDCPVAGTIPDDMVLTNRAWLATHVNTVAGTSFSVPAVAPAPSFNTTPPHTEYPNKDCYAAGHNSSSPTNGEVLFCDDFDASLGTVASGLWQWQRNKTTYDQPAPWNTTFLSEWFGNEYGGAFAGNGYAVCVPKAPTSQSATIESRPFAVPATGASLAFSYKGQTLTGGSFKVDYGAPGSGENDGDWTELQAGPLNQGAEWAEAAYQLSGGSSESTMTSVRFTCSGGSADTNFCAVDSVVISA